MLEVDLTPADMCIEVLEGEPSSIVFVITINDTAVDASTEFPNLVSRTRLPDSTVLQDTVQYQNTNEVVVTVPALTYTNNKNHKTYWELRDLDADKTWVVAQVKIQKDKV